MIEVERENWGENRGKRESWEGEREREKREKREGEKESERASERPKKEQVGEKSEPFSSSSLSSPGYRIECDYSYYSYYYKNANRVCARGSAF